MGWFYGCKLHIVMNQIEQLACEQINSSQHRCIDRS
jgi:hypothetical protein